MSFDWVRCLTHANVQGRDIGENLNEIEIFGATITRACNMIKDKEKYLKYAARTFFRYSKKNRYISDNIRLYFPYDISLLTKFFGIKIKNRKIKYILPCAFCKKDICILLFIGKDIHNIIGYVYAQKLRMDDVYERTNYILEDDIIRKNMINILCKKTINTN